MRIGAWRSTPLNSSATGVRITWTPLGLGKGRSARSRAPDGLGVEVEESARRVVGLLQHLVPRAAVERPELLGRVERGRVQRLAAPELGDLLLDAPVVVAVAFAGRQRRGRPEADVDVQPVGLEGVQVP